MPAPIREINEVSPRLYFSFVERVVVATPSRLHPEMLEIVSVRARRVYYRIHKDKFPDNLESYIVKREDILPIKKR